VPFELEVQSLECWKVVQTVAEMCDGTTMETSEDEVKLINRLDQAATQPHH